MGPDSRCAARGCASGGRRTQAGAGSGHPDIWQPPPLERPARRRHGRRAPFHDRRWRGRRGRAGVRDPASRLAPPAGHPHLRWLEPALGPVRRRVLTAPGFAALLGYGAGGAAKGRAVMPGDSQASERETYVHRSPLVVGLALWMVSATSSAEVSVSEQTFGASSTGPRSGTRIKHADSRQLAEALSGTTSPTRSILWAPSSSWFRSK